MTPDEINVLARLLGEGGLIAVLFYCWQSERRERLESQRAHLETLKESYKRPDAE